jgi:hypothetical protein
MGAVAKGKVSHDGLDFSRPPAVQPAIFYEIKAMDADLCRSQTE